MLTQALKNNDAIGSASSDGHSEIVKLLLADHRVDPSANDNYAIRISSSHGNLEVVKLLLADPRVDPSDNHNYSIRNASNNGHLEIVKLLLTDPRVDPSNGNNYAIRMAAQHGYFEIVSRLLQDPRVDPSVYDNDAIIMASKSHYDVVELLMKDPRVDPSDQNNTAIKSATRFDIVKLLLLDPRVDPSVNDDFAIRDASKHGYHEIVKLLLADHHVNPSADSNVAIHDASRNGNLEVVKLLLADPRVDPSDFDNYAIKIALQNGHLEVVRLLILDPRVDPSVNKDYAIRTMCIHGYLDLIKKLLEDPRVDPSAGDNFCAYTALDNEHFDIVKILMKDRRFKNTQEFRELAMKKGNKDIKRLIALKLKDIIKQKIFPNLIKHDFKSELVCDVFVPLNKTELEFVANLYDVDTKLSRLKICEKLRGILGKYTTSKEKIVGECNNEETSIGGDKVINVPDRKFFSYTQDKKVYCEDLEEFHEYVKGGGTKNPFNGVKLDADTTSRLKKEYKLYSKDKIKKIDINQVDALNYSAYLGTLMNKLHYPRDDAWYRALNVDGVLSFVKNVHPSVKVEKITDVEQQRIEGLKALINFIETEATLDRETRIILVTQAWNDYQ